MEKHLQWLRANKQFLKIKPIEKALKIGDSILVKAVDGKRPLPEAHHSTVIAWIEKFVDIPDGEQAPPKKAAMSPVPALKKVPAKVIAATKVGVLATDKGIPPMPEKMKGESAIDFAERKNVWKKKYGGK